ncbi:MAG TPA: histidinol dehydrogenase [Candidatus Limnocylindria bacterium]|jgi:histidinol dehydrogenase|nr:histidinol dehydrogenase [Candidatus Limnocylindria bacterium]
MNVTRYSDGDFAAQAEKAAAVSSLFDPVIEERTRAILAEVHSRGDSAILEFTERFDGAHLTADQMVVTTAENMRASVSASADLRKAVEEAHGNIEAFAKKSLRKAWEARNSHGAKVGEKFDGFQRVGIYIPGGTAPLVSTALMTITLAKAAGCQEIAVCTPCGKDGTVNPALLFAARYAGATEIYKIGGAQAIAAMAYGTPTVKRVQKVFGPGNAYVVMAKRLLFGYVAIDLLPGPSEVCVLADDSAEPAYIAADMLAQAEHGSGHERIWLVTTSAKILRAVEAEIRKQLPRLPRREYIEKALAACGWLIQAKDLKQGVEIVNRLAPEHCEVMVRGARKVSEEILTAGAIFLGNDSPTVLGDYVAGPSHTLPTGGAGASFAGLTVDQFQRRTSVVEYGKGSAKKALASVRQFALLEGLGAHGESLEVRCRTKK